MRFKEFSDDLDNIKFIKFEFQKTLLALKKDYAKRVKIRKNKAETAKQKRKNKHLKSLRNNYTSNAQTLDRPKR